VPAAGRHRRALVQGCDHHQLHVKAFADSNNDGIGDFAGLTEKPGICRISASPRCGCCRSTLPGRDDGYDIADYGDINPDFGTMKDFRRFIQEAKKRGLRVITELVINHTSDQHDWFKRARRSDPNSSARLVRAIPTRNLVRSSSPIPRINWGRRAVPGTASSRTSRPDPTIRAWWAPVR
jgi:hypothetical protein